MSATIMGPAGWDQHSRAVRLLFIEQLMNWVADLDLKMRSTNVPKRTLRRANTMAEK